MFLILDRNSIYNNGNGNIDVMYVNVDNIKQICVWEDHNAESVHDRWAIQFEFMNETAMDGPRFPDRIMAHQHMRYIFNNAVEIGAGK